ncbi:hypothetical protein CSKR_203377 [Clonorchis sinensis]|uniref:Uncharacterized protein n=2 Tax=Clonorchis sinensis TaxID=79923 RepID=A0A8T1M9J1_CLOSI|nr:hypothetical protein CSKR_203377 [Clonorchis sinensis]GAA35708.2 hypothetical protein CLF_100447 [Clonorchis sinensis]
MASAADVRIPNYGVDEMLKGKLRVIIAVKQLKTSTSFSVNRLIPQLKTIASNGEITFEPSDRGFFFEFVGKDDLKEKHYRMKVDGLPGLLDVQKCQCKLEDDAVHLILQKKNPSVSWLKEIGDKLPLVD